MDMKKRDLITMFLCVPGAGLFALGMCMALVEEWGMFQKGIIAGVAGLIILLITVIVWRRMEGKSPIRLNAKTVGSVLAGVLGALLLGVGMCLCMVFDKMIPGVIIGLVGILALLMLIPMTKGIHG